MDLAARLRMVATLGQGVVRGLPDAAPEREPLELLDEWYETAKSAGLILPDAFALATATPEGVPSVRMVLVKGIDTHGVVFFTNYGSRKASELDANPVAAMCFHWAILQRQVRLEGRIVRVSREESDAYFESRARGSRIGAWASDQSRPLESRSELRDRVQAREEEFRDRSVPRPEFWGGYRLIPHRIEFWQGRADRLHDRLVFERSTPDDDWSTGRLFP